MLRVKGVRISQMARKNCQGSSECPSGKVSTLVALRGGIELPPEASRRVIALPHDSAIELVLLVGRLFARRLFDLLLLTEVTNFIGADPPALNRERGSGRDQIRDSCPPTPRQCRQKETLDATVGRECSDAVLLTSVGKPTFPPFPSPKPLSI